MHNNLFSNHNDNNESYSSDESTAAVIPTTPSTTTPPLVFSTITTTTTNTTPVAMTIQNHRNNDNGGSNVVEQQQQPPPPPSTQNNINNNNEQPSSSSSHIATTGSWWKDTLIHQYVNLTSAVSRPKMPKYFTSNFYLTLNDPQLDTIKSASVNERVKLRRQTHMYRTGEDTFLPLLHEFVRNVHNRARRWIQTPSIATILFLVLLGFIAAVASVLIEVMLSHMINARQIVATLAVHYSANWMLWIAYGMFFAFLSSCCVQHISPYIVGSGMPEMKTIISGIKMDKVLSLRTMIAKFFGVATTISGGFVVGRVGPFSHIIACMAEQLLKIRLFKRLHNNDFVRCNILSAACAAGVSATFGAPIGGVLFSVEITSTYFLVSNVWRGLLCSMICAFFFYMARLLGFVSHHPEFLSLFPTNFRGVQYKPYEYGLFVLLGILIGIAGGMFITIFVALIKARNRRPWLRDAKYWTVMLLCLVIACVDFHIPLLKNPPGKTMNMLFGITNLNPKFGKYLHLSLYVGLKYIFTILSMCLPIPSGQVVQSFMMGAGAGRLFGELMHDLIPGVTNPAGYAVMGACAWAASTTRAYSMVLIVLEITGQLNYLVPCMVCTVVAVAVASCISDSIYDIMIKVRNLPYLSMPDVYTGQNVMAFNIMQTKVDVITCNSSAEEILKLLIDNDHDSFPVVDDKENLLLLGEAQRQHIQQMLEKAEENMSNKKQTVELENIELVQQPVALPQSEKTVSPDSSNTPVIPQTLVQLEDTCMVLPNPFDDVYDKSMAASSSSSAVQQQSDQKSDGSSLSSSLPAEQEPDQPTLRNRKTKDSSITHQNMRIVIHAAKYIALNKGTENEMMLQIDPSPFCITELTTMNKIFYLYTMLGLSHAWVVSFGRLTGVLTKRNLIDASNSMEQTL